MRKQIITLVFSGLVFSGLLITGIAITFSKKSNHTDHSVIDEVVRAHNLALTQDASAAFVAEATKVLRFHTDSKSAAPGTMECQVTVAYNGSLFIHRLVDPQGSFEQIDLLENGAGYRTAIEAGSRTKTAAPLGSADYESLKFRVMSFGLIPILKQLQEPTVEVLHHEGTEADQERLTVKIASNIWTVYVDQEHLIRKIERVRERRNLTIEYLDYHTVGGAQLPFTERISVDGRLTYELFFTRIERNPSFPDDYFSREALAKRGGR